MLRKLKSTSPCVKVCKAVLKSLKSCNIPENFSTHPIHSEFCGFAFLDTGYLEFAGNFPSPSETVGHVIYSFLVFSARGIRAQIEGMRPV